MKSIREIWGVSAHSDGHRTGEGGRVEDLLINSDAIFEQPLIVLY